MGGRRWVGGRVGGRDGEDGWEGEDGREGWRGWVGGVDPKGGRKDKWVGGRGERIFIITAHHQRTSVPHLM